MKFIGGTIFNIHFRRVEHIKHHVATLWTLHDIPYLRAMEFLDPKLDEYAGKHTSAESELLKKINRETHLEVLQPRMLSGHLQGRFLSMMAKVSRPLRILEVGTYTGYSALCMAEGLPTVQIPPKSALLPTKTPACIY